MQDGLRIINYTD